MPKIKPLSDYPSPRADLMEQRHSDDEIANIAEQFNIADTTALRNELSQALDLYECYRQNDESKRNISEQRRMLKILDDRADRLHEVMVKLGPIEHELLDGATPEIVDLIWGGIIDDVEKLGIAARYALAGIDGKRSKRDKSSKWEIVKFLAKAWLNLVGEIPVIKHNSTTDEYSGDFLKFLYLGAAPAGVTKFNLSGKTVSRVLDEYGDKL